MRSNKYLFFIIMAVAGLYTACSKVDAVPRSEQNALGDIFATIPSKGDARLFEPVYSANNDTIYFNIPYFYPVDSDNQTDLSKLIVRMTVPSDAIVTPAFSQVVDLSKPLAFQVTSGTGKKASYTLVAKRVADLAVRKATIEYQDNGSTQDLDAIVNPNGDVIFYVIPGTNVSQVKFSYTLNPHSTGSIAQGTVIDLTQPVPFTVTGVDGSKQTYTLKSQEPRKLAYGVGISRLYWKKTNTDLPGLTADDNNRAMAVSGDYLVVVASTTPSTFKVYNRKTGAFVQNMTAPPLAGFRSFAVFNDTAGHILTASWTPKNSTLSVYKYDNVFDTNPVLLFSWVNNNPTAIAGDGGVGRRFNMYGDITRDAVIMATAGVSTVIYRWTIQGGTLTSATPTPLTYQSITGGTTWSFYVEAQPTTTTAGDYFVNYPAEIALVNGSSNARSTAFTTETAVVGTSHMPMDYVTFNNAKYLAVVTFKNATSTRAGLSLFDVTNTSKIGLKSTDAGFADFRVFASADELSSSSNGNAVADVCTCYSDDRERLYVYTLLTNGGIMAHEFTKYAP